MLKKIVVLAALSFLLAFGAGTAAAGSFMIDLNHPIPTFKPMSKI